MPSYKTTGIIIRRRDFKETDRMFSILSIDHGVVEAIAKGVRKPTSKLASHLELFCQIELMFARGRSLDIVTSARLIQDYRHLGEDYELIRRAFLFCEMIDKLVKQTAGPSTYHLLAESLAGLNTGQHPAVVELYFKLKLLDQLGYRPNLEQTVKSRDEIMAHKSYHFSSEGGGLVEAHEAQVENPAISAEHVKLWRLILKHPLAQLLKVKNIDKPSQQSLPIANEFYDYLFGKRFRSNEI